MPIMDLRDGELVALTHEEAQALATSPAIPSEVAMHRVKKAAALTPWPGFSDLEAAIYSAIDSLAPPSNRLARIEFDSAPNLVRDGSTTLAIMAVLGMTEVQRDDLLTFAASLP